MEGFDGEADGAILFPGRATEFYMVSIVRWSPSQEGTPNEMTIAFWTYWNGSTGSWQDIINKRNNWADNAMMWCINQHAPTGSILSLRKNGMNADSKDSLLNQQWTLAAIALDGTNAYFHKNGEKYDEFPYIYGTGDSAMINLGTSDNGTGPRPNDVNNGTLDDVRFYDRVLSDDEIMDIYEGKAEYNKPIECGKCNSLMILIVLFSPIPIVVVAHSPIPSIVGIAAILKREG